MSEKSYLCCGCGNKTNAFPNDCPDCGASTYERSPPGADGSSEEPLEKNVAKLSRAVNPIAPV